VRGAAALARRAEIEAPPDPALYGRIRALAADEGVRFVVSLGGGSLPGLCGNAMLLQVLEELGLLPRVAEVWGTSAGAVVGAAWASGLPVAEVVRRGKEILSPRMLDVPRTRLALALLGGPFGARLPDGLVRGRRIREALATMILVPNVEDCRVPFRCVAVADDGTARRKVFRRGPIVPAVYASMSVPGVFLPGPAEEEDGTNYLDGGLAEKTPLFSPISEHRRVGGDQRLVLVSTQFRAEGRRTPPRGFLRRFLHAVEALENLAWRYQLAEARAQEGVTVLLLESGIQDTRLFDFERIDEHLLSARAAYKDGLTDAHLARAFGAG
jgi:predicted acylesterase/phospholipase RssA